MIGAAHLAAHPRASDRLEPRADPPSAKPLARMATGRHGRPVGGHWPLVLALIAVTGAALGLRRGVGLNVSRSAPRGIYRAVAGTPVRGALVVACLPVTVAVFGRGRGYLAAGPCPGQAQPVLKRVGAVARDLVELGREGVTVNGVRLLARPIEPCDSAGRYLPHVPFGSYSVRMDEVWLVGHSPDRSWDSRYFGPVSLTAIGSVVRPVLTWDRFLGVGSRGTPENVPGDPALPDAALRNSPPTGCAARGPADG